MTVVVSWVNFSALLSSARHQAAQTPTSNAAQEQPCGAMARALCVFPFPQMLGSAVGWPGGKGQVGPAASLGFKVSSSSSKQRHSLEWPFVQTELGEPEQPILVVLEVAE